MERQSNRVLSRWPNLCLAGPGCTSRFWCLSNACAPMCGILLSLQPLQSLPTMGPEGNRSGIRRFYSWMGCLAPSLLGSPIWRTYSARQDSLETVWREPSWVTEPQNQSQKPVLCRWFHIVPHYRWSQESPTSEKMMRIYLPEDLSSLGKRQRIL